MVLVDGLVVLGVLNHQMGPRSPKFQKHENWHHVNVNSGPL